MLEWAGAWHREGGREGLMGTEEGLETSGKVAVTGQGEEELAKLRGTWVLHPDYAKGYPWTRNFGAEAEMWGSSGLVLVV